MKGIDSRIDLACIFAAFVFIGHIIGNLAISRPTTSRVSEMERLSLFPPPWVFGIWLVIWTLQGVMIAKTYGTGFWDSANTLLFLGVCAGNLGSQVAGAKGLGWVLYIVLLSVMAVCAISLMFKGIATGINPSIVRPATQLYVGWALIAMVVGTGFILVGDLKIVPDAAFTVFGVTVLFAVPLCIWVSWAFQWSDFRVVSYPFFLVLVALFPRLLLHWRS